MVDDCSFGLPKVGTWIVVVVGVHSHSPLIVGDIRTLMAVDVGPSLAVADTASAASLYSAGHSHVVVAIFNTMLDFPAKNRMFLCVVLMTLHDDMTRPEKLYCSI